MLNIKLLKVCKSNVKIMLKICGYAGVIYWFVLFSDLERSALKYQLASDIQIICIIVPKVITLNDITA